MLIAANGSLASYTFVYFVCRSTNPPGAQRWTRRWYERAVPVLGTLSVCGASCTYARTTLRYPVL